MIQIIENGPETAPALQQLFLAYQQAISSLADSSSYPFIPFEEATAGELILIAPDGDCIAGFVSVWLPDRFIHHLYVDAAYRRQGIASALLWAAIIKAGLPVQLKCLEANTTALQFYRRTGFKCIEHSFSEEGPYQLMQLSEAPYGTAPHR